jgi:hypothetical protein
MHSRVAFIKSLKGSMLASFVIIIYLFGFNHQSYQCIDALVFKPPVFY